MLTVVTIALLTPSTLQLSLLPYMKATQCNLVCHITSEDILGPMIQGSADVSCTVVILYWVCGLCVSCSTVVCREQADKMERSGGLYCSVCLPWDGSQVGQGTGD